MGNNSQLGFYLWAYNNVESVDYVLGSMRKAYPDSDLVISSDNGEDFTDICEKHRAIHYIHGNESHGPSHASLGGNGRYGWTANEAKLWLSRVYDACKNISNNYVMLLEEDVLVKERFSFVGYDLIMIPNIKNPISRVGMEWVAGRGGRTDYPYYSAGGGSIIKREAFIDAYEKHMDSLFEHYEDLYQKSMSEGSIGWGWNDNLICVLMYANNASFSADLPIIESGNEDDPAPIIHAFKKYYRKNLIIESPEKKIVFYHAYLVGNYKMIIQEQIEKLVLSGLYAACDSVQLCVATPDDSRLEWIKKITRNLEKINLTVIKIDKTQYPNDYRESKITLQKLKEMADTVPGYYCYFHTKATSNPGYNIEMWRKSCDWATICEWEKNIKMLNEGYDAVGPNLRPDAHIGQYPHFSGTYWWSTHKHIRTLDFSYLTDVHNKYLEEFWIGSNHSAKLGSTYESGHIAPYMIESEIDTYITPSKSKRNLILIPAVTRNPVISQFLTEDERLEQLLGTIKSVKEKVPSSHIVVLEGGTFSEEDARKMISTGADEVFSHDLEKNGKRLPDPNRTKSYGEITLFLEYFKTPHFAKIKPSIRTISKIGGRGLLNEKFRFPEDDTCIMNYTHKAWSGRGACSGRIWRIPMKHFPHLLSQMSLMYQNFDNVLDIEHGFYDYNVVPLEGLAPEQLVGISAWISGNGKWEEG